MLKDTSLNVLVCMNFGFVLRTVCLIKLDGDI